MLVEVDPELVRRFVADQIASPQRFNSRISCDDEMYLHALHGYKGNAERTFLTYSLQGKQMLDAVQQIVSWAFEGWKGVSTFLDFAGGHGRFTRYLVQEIDPRQVWVSDLYQDALYFQREQFRVNAFSSSVEPEAFSAPRKFDFIFVSSLFSHLPRETFGRWFETLYSLLEDHGVLAFTTHGIEFAGSPGKEFVFRPESESRSLDVDTYGTAFSSMNFVASAIAEAVGDGASWRCIPHGHLGFQDLYLVSRDASADLSRLAFDPGFFGHLGSCWMRGDGTLHLRGWAADLGSEQPTRVRVLENDRLVHEVLPDHDRPDVARYLGSDRGLRSGWSCSLPAAGIRRDAWIAIKAVNRDDRDRLISLGRLESMLAWFSPAK